MLPGPFKGAQGVAMNRKKTIMVFLLAAAMELFLRLDFSNASMILTELRLPRLILAFGVGSALALSGAVMQTVLNNPLVEPYTLGIASGAALGAALFQSFGLNLSFFGMNSGAVLGSVLMMILLFRILFKTRLRFDSVVLLGVMLSFSASSLLAIWTVLADPAGVQSLHFWLMGDLSRAGMKTAVALLLLSLIFFAYFFRFSKKLDAFLFGETMAEGFGVSPQETQKISVLLISILIGFCVSAVGIIGFVGLMVPHFIRKKMNTSLHRTILPYVFVWGGICLMMSDALAHTLAFPLELPVGAVTALVGAPLFIRLFVFRKLERGIEL